MAQMLDPEVLADMIDAEVGKAIRFAPLAEVDTTLEGQPGTTLTVPKWDYIGDAETVIVMNPADASTLRLDAAKEWLGATEVGANRVVSGVYGEVLGVQIVRSRKCPKGTAYMVRKGALRIMLKRNTMVETDRDITKAINQIVANKHYGVYLYKAEKAVKITLKDAAKK